MTPPADTPPPVDSAEPSGPPAPRWLDWIDRVAMTFAVAIALLLFAQWPLRDLAGSGNGPTQANDLAQWLFALYVAVALRHAGRRGAHLVARPDLAADNAGRRARLRRIGAALCVLPWALFLVFTAAAPVMRSVEALELFPDTFNPGYFMIKVALLLLAALLALQSALDLWQELRPANPPEDTGQPGQPGP
ncbi:Tripartite ATP-independent transporter, DctQ component [Variovorax sp. YR750]|uniref:TRAP transporter small permease subunit n=1 Tax=Variovorax sp. NFACC28 TaxID=1566273 RepID=UPI000894EA24|nr:Tripartite ATP-independent transporter, DctQ component [Variovorax sp. NFACC28]SEG89911.1 Tripartite ATP-independent transporter, DctQ component [Variovorax sp. NFACC29]SEL93931.1 Tripartite ATP-independent transporter, DctQ component [Variovorax sp. YR750]SFD38864.1 Tripartite ATP-independent transporter, DctQ component [Variovorax sp. NFACC26]SFG41466.1 Tripartite ATP-independent transporter, DctQ component [Variovorax sp. NFACC27]